MEGSVYELQWFFMQQYTVQCGFHKRGGGGGFNNEK
jgi:hypothetical protein